MTVSEIKAILTQLGGTANKSLGQHFLVDKAALDVMVQAADIHPGEHILEIGPGLGVLTHALMEAGACVTAIEQDRRFLGLIAPMAEKVMHGDASALDWSEVMGDKPWKMVANLPYSFTSLALRKALYSRTVPERVTVLIQREVAERAVARDGHQSLLSLMVALATDEATIVRRVPAGAFFPPPNVESAILFLHPLSYPQRQEKWGVDLEQVMAVAKRGFAHPRKYLASNLGLKESQKIWLKTLGFSEKARAEELSPAAWVALVKQLLRGETPPS